MQTTPAMQDGDGIAPMLAPQDDDGMTALYMAKMEGPPLGGLRETHGKNGKLSRFEIIF